MKRRLLVVLAFIGLPFTAAAQRVTLTPSVGAYFPLAEQGRFSLDIGGYGSPPRIAVTYARQTSAPVLGVKVAAQWTVVGVEGAVTTAGSTRFAYSTYARPQPSVEWREARVTSTTLRVMARLHLNEDADLTFGLGPAGTRLSGPAYRANYSRTAGMRWGGSLTATLGVKVTPRLRAEVSTTDVVYGVGRPAVTQHDFVVAAGLGWVLGS